MKMKLVMELLIRMSIKNKLRMTFKNCKGYCNSIKRMSAGYQNNQRYCAVCKYYTTVTDKFCFCCGTQMRTNARDQNLKNKRMNMKIKN